MEKSFFFFLRDPVNRTNVCNILCSLYWTVSEGCSPNVAAYLLCLSAVVRYIKVKKEGQRKKKTEKNTLAATRRDLLTFSLRCIVPRLCLDRVCIVPSPRIWGCPLVDAAMVTSSTCHILHKVYMDAQNWNGTSQSQTKSSSIDQIWHKGPINHNLITL